MNRRPRLREARDERALLRALGRWWDKAGKDDPLYAILTEPETQGRAWDEDRFFSIGRKDVEEALARLRSAGWTLGTERALDFGCGVGRLTQALAEHFDIVEGVDIAPSMIAAAERYNRFGSRCRYRVNARPDLSIFDDATFDLVFSLVVLQHIPPDLARRYVEEFIRVLRPTGLAVFQIATAVRQEQAAGKSSPVRGIARKALRRPPSRVLQMHATAESAVRSWIDAGGGAVIAAWPLSPDEFFDSTLFAVAAA